MQNTSFHCILCLIHIIIRVRICETHCVFVEECRVLRSFMKLWSDAFAAARRFIVTENGACRSRHIKVCPKVCALRERDRENTLHPQAIWPRPRNTSVVPKKGWKVPTSRWKYFLLSCETFARPVAVSLVITLIPPTESCDLAQAAIPFSP